MKSKKKLNEILKGIVTEKKSLQRFQCGAYLTGQKKKRICHLEDRARKITMYL